MPHVGILAQRDSMVNSMVPCVMTIWYTMMTTSTERQHGKQCGTMCGDNLVYNNDYIYKKRRYGTLCWWWWFGTCCGAKCVCSQHPARITSLPP